MSAKEGLNIFLTILVFASGVALLWWVVVNIFSNQEVLKWVKIAGAIILFCVADGRRGYLLSFSKVKTVLLFHGKIFHFLA